MSTGQLEQSLRETGQADVANRQQRQLAFARVGLPEPVPVIHDTVERKSREEDFPAHRAWLDSLPTDRYGLPICPGARVVGMEVREGYSDPRESATREDQTPPLAVVEGVGDLVVGAEALHALELAKTG